MRFLWGRTCRMRFLQTAERERTAIPSSAIIEISIVVINIDEAIIGTLRLLGGSRYFVFFLAEARPISSCLTYTASIIGIIYVNPIVNWNLFLLILLFLAEFTKQASCTRLRHINVSASCIRACLGIVLIICWIISVFYVTILRIDIGNQLISYRGKRASTTNSREWSCCRYRRIFRGLFPKRRKI